MDPYGGPHVAAGAEDGAAPSSPRSGSPSRASRSSSRTAGARRAAGRPGTGRWPATSPPACSRTRSPRCTRRRSSSPTWTEPGRDPRLVVRRVPGGARGAAPPRRLPRRDRRRAGHRLAAVRHALHRALPGRPGSNPAAYEVSSLNDDPERAVATAVRPLLIIHGLADDNVFVAHSLRLSSALLAAGLPALGAAAVRCDAHDSAGGRRGKPAAAAGRVPPATPCRRRGV